MTANIKAAGYMIQDIQGNAIYGIGDTEDDAWAMVLDVVGPFLNPDDEEIDADKVRDTQYKTYGATAALIAQVNTNGGAIVWSVVEGVACTIAEEESAYDPA